MTIYKEALECPMCDGTTEVKGGPDHGKKCKDCKNGFCDVSDGIDNGEVKTKADYEKYHSKEERMKRFEAKQAKKTKKDE